MNLHVCVFVVCMSLTKEAPKPGRSRVCSSTVVSSDLISGLTFSVCVLGQEDAALIHSKLNCVQMCTSGIELYQLCKYTVEQTDETAWL